MKTSPLPFIPPPWKGTKRTRLLPPLLCIKYATRRLCAEHLFEYLKIGQEALSSSSYLGSSASSVVIAQKIGSIWLVPDYILETTNLKDTLVISKRLFPHLWFVLCVFIKTTFMNLSTCISPSVKLDVLIIRFDFIRELMKLLLIDAKITASVITRMIIFWNRNALKLR